MARDEEEEDEQPRKRKKKKGFWSTTKILVACLLIFGIVVGAVIEHFYIEPLLEPHKVEQLRLCQSQNTLLNQENENCLRELSELKGNS
ncbi:MAG: hypothetical protein JW772_00925 [Candidatus Diapherotrites archaeon]|nr:hypothetical protein [Candidatus Diapherotrites archaeon]